MVCIVGKFLINHSRNIMKSKIIKIYLPNRNLVFETGIHCSDISFEDGLVRIISINDINEIYKPIAFEYFDNLCTKKLLEVRANFEDFED